MSSPQAEISRMLADLTAWDDRQKLYRLDPGEVPNIIDFVVKPEWLNRPGLYPRQATLLKVFFLQEELFTTYDYSVIDEWTRDFADTGNHGIVPDVLERMRTNKAEGRLWFREIDAIIGRRGGKGFLGAIAGAYVLWHYLQVGRVLGTDEQDEFYGDPQGYYGIDRDKRLSGMVFGGKLGQAKANLWRDLVNVILGAPCYEPYISTALGGSLTVYTPEDMKQGRDKRSRSTMDRATFEIVPKESTAMAGRGPASFMQFYDEMAHVVKATASADASEVYEAATPALDQFGKDGFIFAPSSPWQKVGQFYENCQRALEVDEQTGKAVYPEMLLVQLTSWDPYEDWDLTIPSTDFPLGMPMRPPLAELGETSIEQVPYFKPLRGAVQAYDDQMQRLELANPASFKVERRSHWAATTDAYLNEKRVHDIFKPFTLVEDGEPRSLVQQTKGRMDITYKMHGDPSKSGANFGLSIAHVEWDDEGWPHVVFDVVKAWQPQDFPDNRNEMDYRKIEVELKGWIDAFVPEEVSFDQFNSIHTIQELRHYVRTKSLPKRVQIFERTATRPINWEVAETFKTAIGLGLVHAPQFDLVEQELLFLQDLGGRVDHQTTGPVQTKDVADTMMILVHALIGDKMKAFLAGELSAVVPRPGLPGGIPPRAGMREPEQTPQERLSSFGRGRGGQGERFGRNGRPGGPALPFGRTRGRGPERFY